MVPRLVHRAAIPSLASSHGSSPAGAAAATPVTGSVRMSPTASLPFTTAMIRNWLPPATGVASTTRSARSSCPPILSNSRAASKHTWQANDAAAEPRSRRVASAHCNENRDVDCHIEASSMELERIQLLHLGDDLVIGVTELVAARAEVFVAEFVDGDLDRRADDRGHELAVVDGIGRGRAEITGLGQIADLARLD